MNARGRSTTKRQFRCMECSAGTVRPLARPGREAKYRTLSLPVPATLEIPTCDNCGTEWINDTVAESLDRTLEAEYRARMRELVTAAVGRLSERSVSKSAIEKLLGLSQGYLSHLTTTGDKTPSEALALDLVLLAQDPRRLRAIEALWQKLSGPRPDFAGALTP